MILHTCIGFFSVGWPLYSAFVTDTATVSEIDSSWNSVVLFQLAY